MAGWIDTVGNWADTAVKDFGNDIGWATAMHDLASVGSNDKKWLPMKQVELKFVNHFLRV